jgi:hypothetical protein
MPTCVLYGDLSVEKRTSRWIRNREPPTVRGSATKWRLTSGSRIPTSSMKASAGSCTSAA